MTEHPVANGEACEVYGRASTDDGGVTYRKQIAANEADLYRELSDNRKLLESSSPDVRVYTPTLLEYDQESRIGVLGSLGDFPTLDIEGYFGETDFLTKDYIDAMLSTFCVVQSMPLASCVVQNDYEAIDEHGNVSSLSFALANYDEAHDTLTPTLRTEIERMANKTQNDIELMPQFFSHRDPNLTNYRIEWGDRPSVYIVDWETSGASRVGYDTGRFMTYLALNPKLQEYLATKVKERYETLEQLYVWRVAAMRGCREIISIATGRYDERLQVHDAGSRYSQSKNRRVANSLRRIIELSLEELKLLTGVA